MIGLDEGWNYAGHYCKVLNLLMLKSRTQVQILPRSRKETMKIEERLTISAHHLKRRRRLVQSELELEAASELSRLRTTTEELERDKKMLDSIFERTVLNRFTDSSLKATPPTFVVKAGQTLREAWDSALRDGKGKP